MVKGAFQCAIEEGKSFADVDAVDDYLAKEGLSAEFLVTHTREIFSCYLQLSHQLEAQQTRRPPSPPPSLSSPVNASNTSLEREDCSDQGDPPPPTLDSDETFVISFFRPRRNDFHVLNAKTCKGSFSYISENIARKHHLKSERQYIILSWRYTGGKQSNESLNTRCEIVKPEWLPGCDIAFGEECGKQDSEESEDDEDDEDDDDEEDNAESPSKSQFNDMVPYRAFETFGIHDFSPEQELRVRQTTTEMILDAATLIEKRRAAKLPPTPFTLPSCPPAPQRTTRGKRSRRS